MTGSNAPLLRLSGAYKTKAHPCAEPDGWPEVDITLTFYCENTDNLELVDLLGSIEQERLVEDLMGGPA